MSVTTVKEYLKQWNKDAAVREFEVSSATVELAAQALGVEPARIAKTLSFSDDGDGCILIVAAEDRQCEIQSLLSPQGADALAGRGDRPHRPCNRRSLSVRNHKSRRSHLAGRVAETFHNRLSGLRQQQLRDRTYLRRTGNLFPRPRLDRRVQRLDGAADYLLTVIIDLQKIRFLMLRDRNFPCPLPGLQVSPADGGKLESRKH